MTKKKYSFAKNAIKFTEPLLNKYPIYEVSWIDASGYSGWMPMHEESSLMYCISVGYIIGEDKYRLIMSGSLTSTAEKGDTRYIPKGCILNKRKINPERDRTRKNVRGK